MRLKIKMIKFIFCTLLLLQNIILIFSTTTENIENSIERGKEKANICATCHNIDGNSTIPMWPKLAGQFSTYIFEQLKAFKNNKKNERQNQIMYNIVKDLTEKDFYDLSRYFSIQKTMQKNTPNTNTTQFYAGKALYHVGSKSNGIPACAACHGANAQGNEFAGIPKLQSQHAEYVIQQLENYKTGQRATDYNNIMRDITYKLNTEQIKSVADYISNI